MRASPSGTRIASRPFPAVLAVGLAVAALLALQAGGPAAAPSGGSRPLKSITINTQAYGVEPGTVDRRSDSIVAPEDMHIVAIEHFNGVGKGGWSDNGHILSRSPDNPWVKWQKAGTGMEPTGATGYFGYCGRDYYSEVSGIGDVIIYESFPAGTHFFVPKGERLYMHCYACNFRDSVQYFHHAVRLIYW